MLLPELVLLTAVSCCGWVAAAAWQQESPMDDKGNVVLFWTVDVKKNVLMVEIQGRTLGYVALGISPNGTMEGADLLIGYVDYEGEPHVLAPALTSPLQLQGKECGTCVSPGVKDAVLMLENYVVSNQDYWASKNGPPILDESQDWKLMAGRQNDTHTMIRVRRPITPSTKDDIDVFDFPMWILWAWHPHDPGEDLHPEYHQNNRGARRLCILRSDCWPPSPPPPTRGAAASLTATVAVAAASCLLVLLPQLHLLL